MTQPNKRTKIVCTLGPASEKPTVLKKMAKAGMNVARLNFSHGTFTNHKKLMKNIRSVSKKLNKPIAIMQDLQGPKIRVGKLPEKGIMLRAGSETVITTDKKKHKGKIPCTYDLLHKDVQVGDTLLLDDGLLELKVKKTEGKDIVCRVVVGGRLTSHKGINLPETTLSVPAITKKDEKDVEFGVKNNVDYIALSFVKNAKEVYDLRYLIRQYEKKMGIKDKAPVKIIVKIEKHEAIANFDEILEATDGVMVARGDLGIETPAEDVPLLQKEIIEKTMKASKPVIVATQMLDSMIRNPRPTRAEVSDVANAVIDHTDAVMLSGESATGKYPVQTVETMHKIINETEASTYDDVEPTDITLKYELPEEAISNAATILAGTMDAKLILAASLSGDTGRLVSKFRPELPILVATDNERVRRQLSLSWGVIPFILPKCRSVEEFIDRAVGYLKNNKFVTKGDKIVIIVGEPVGSSGNINMLEIKSIK